MNVCSTKIAARLDSMFLHDCIISGYSVRIEGIGRSLFAQIVLLTIGFVDGETIGLHSMTRMAVLLWSRL